MQHSGRVSDYVLMSRFNLFRLMVIPVTLIEKKGSQISEEQQKKTD